MFLPIYLRGELPDEDYEWFCKLSKLIELATQHTLSDAKINHIDTGFREFNQYYEDRFYGQKWNCLPACLPVYHQVLHVANGLRWIEPMHLYAQWAMERICESLTRTAKSRVSANRNMEITLVQTEQKYALSFVLAESDWNGAKEYAEMREQARDRENNVLQEDSDEEDFDALGLERNMGAISLAHVFEKRVINNCLPELQELTIRRVQEHTLRYRLPEHHCSKLG